MSCTLLRPFRPEDRKLRVIDGKAGPLNSTVPVPRYWRLVTAQEGQCKTILLAYDSESVRRVLAAIMIGQGYSVTCCGDGDAALRYLRSNRADLVVTGMVMPNMDGLQLIRRLQGLQGHLPILALAEEADQMSRIYLRYAGLAGAASTHTVPVRRDIFLYKICNILGGAPHAIRNAVW